MKLKQLIGVDLNSKFESAPGLKEASKIKQFITHTQTCQNQKQYNNNTNLNVTFKLINHHNTKKTKKKPKHTKPFRQNNKLSQII